MNVSLYFSCRIASDWTKEAIDFSYSYVHNKFVNMVFKMEMVPTLIIVCAKDS